MGEKWVLPPDQARVELEKILTFDLVDTFSFYRGHVCLRALGVPVNTMGNPAAIDFQDGDEAREMWDSYQDERDLLKEKHQDWKETQ